MSSDQKKDIVKSSDDKTAEKNKKTEAEEEEARLALLDKSASADDGSKDVKSKQQKDLVPNASKIKIRDDVDQCEFFAPKLPMALPCASPAPTHIPAARAPARSPAAAAPKPLVIKREGVEDCEEGLGAEGSSRD